MEGTVVAAGVRAVWHWLHQPPGNPPLTKQRLRETAAIIGDIIVSVETMQGGYSSRPDVRLHCMVMTMSKIL